MHAPSLQKWHLFDLSITFVKHHQKLVETLLIVALIGLMYSVAAHLNAFSLPELGRETEMSRVVAGDVGHSRG